MVTTLLYIVLFLVLASGAVAGYFFLRQYLGAGGGFASSFFGPKPERRLDVVEQTSVDGRRRLILIRRDDVEHLIMTGGPVDVVIETGINAPRAPAEQPVYNRPARTFSAAPVAQAVNGGTSD